ncbi:MAG: leucine-rich repeat domain-containing protein [Bacteroidetes bacterium]|nr:MAG: leucine-rich repeat domain-containing protein [Bacteroidota bacterium]
MDQVPDSLARLKYLRELNLSRNKLSSFPDALLQFVELRKLSLNRNEISRLPEEIDRLEKLEYLDVWDNPIPNFPENLVHLKMLNEFHAEGIKYGPKFQEKWIQRMPHTKFFFDAPCDCRE